MLREVCDCDISGECPYGATSYSHCEWHCGEPDTQDDFDIWEEYSDDEFPYEWMPVDGEE